MVTFGFGKTDSNLFFTTFASPNKNAKTMKKLFLLLAVGTLLMVGCDNTRNQNNNTTPLDSATVAQQEKLKKDKADWDNWDSLTDERKAELLDSQKAVYDMQKAMKEAREARRAKFEAAMENWDNLSLDERRAAFDLITPKKPIIDSSAISQKSSK